MSQEFTDDCFAPDHEAQVDMANIKKNFAALKSSFSGTTAPANLVAGMFWYDTTANILKLRNEANTAWQDVWNFASNKPVITNLSNEITLEMLSSAIKDAAAGTYSLRTLGTGAAQACAGNDARLSNARPASSIPAAMVSQSILKTTTGSVSVVVSTNVLHYTGAIPGGEYGFMENIQTTGGFSAIAHYLGHGYPGGFQSYDGYRVPFGAFQGDVSGTEPATCYVRARYVQACGEVHWIFSLKNRETGIIEKSWQAPDHPCFGCGGDPERVAHPFGDYDQDKYELIVITPPLDFVKELKQKAGRGKCILSVIKDEYVIDDLSSPAWPSEKVAVALPEEWEDAWHTGQPVEDVKSAIPKPKQAVTRVLKKK